jgi:hypothetical protein
MVVRMGAEMVDGLSLLVRRMEAATVEGLLLEEERMNDLWGHF